MKDKVYIVTLEVIDTMGAEIENKQMAFKSKIHAQGYAQELQNLFSGIANETLKLIARIRELEKEKEQK